jgi:ornithine cyclodeaminase
VRHTTSALLTASSIDVGVVRPATTMSPYPSVRIAWVCVSDCTPVPTMATSIEDAVRSADVVCLTTHAADPVIRRDWLRPGTHVNSVGYNPQGTGEVDRRTVEDAYVVVESRGSALAPPPAGAVELWQGLDVVEVGEIVAGDAPGRSSDDQLTLYKSVGVAVQDAATAAFVLAEARTRNLGTEVDL